MRSAKIPIRMRDVLLVALLIARRMAAVELEYPRIETANVFR